MKKIMSKSNGAAMRAAIKDMASEFDYIFDCSNDKMMIENLITGKEYEFD